MSGGESSCGLVAVIAPFRRFGQPVGGAVKLIFRPCFLREFPYMPPKMIEARCGDRA